MTYGDESRTDRLVSVAAPTLDPVRPGPSSARRDPDGDDRAILDDDGADEEAAFSDGACLAQSIPAAGSIPPSACIVMKLAAATGGHARRLPDLCRYRC